jgi:hypothetical protein
MYFWHDSRGPPAVVASCLQGNLAVATDTRFAANNVFPGKSVFVSVAMVMTIIMIIFKIVSYKRLYCVSILCGMTTFNLYSEYLRKHFVSRMFVLSFYCLPLLGTDFKHFSGLTLILLTSTKWWAPASASKWRMGFNSDFKELSYFPAARVTSS